MIDKMGNYILDNFLYKDEDLNGDKREIMLFGITRILEDIPKYIIIFILSIVLNIIPQVLIVLLVTIVYKTFIGGAHASTNIQCLVFSLIYFIAPVYISKYIQISQNILYILYALVLLTSVYVILKIAPADTEEIPILNKKKRNKLKVIGFISLSFIYIISIFIIKDIYTQILILLNIFSVNILATKPAYRFFKCKYSYESDEFKEYFQN